MRFTLPRVVAYLTLPALAGCALTASALNPQIEGNVVQQSALTGTTDPAAEPSATASAQAKGCSILPVITRRSGSGAEMTISIRGSSASWKIGQVPGSWYADPPVTSRSWNLYFQGFYWASELAPQVVAAGDHAALEALVNAAAQYHRVNPDLGTNLNGWDEGTNLRRQQTLNCLYRASRGDPRLRPAIVAAAKANMDVSRYYGLPLRAAHNHGAMANLTLIDSAELLGRPSWRAFAARRLVRDSTSVWTEGGLSLEQSSAYNQFNALLWSSIARELSRLPDRDSRSAAQTISKQITEVKRAMSHLTTPSGSLVPYGDATPKAFIPTPQPRRVMRDDAAGVVTGRWSWSNPKTSYYLLRYGPARRKHGHHDRTALVWHTRGVPVLIDPGTYSYDPGPFRTFGVSAEGHNTQQVTGRTAIGQGGVRLARHTHSGAIHELITTDALYGILHTRTWKIDNATHRVTLIDEVEADATTQSHLDARWRLTATSPDRRTATFKDAQGRTLIVRGSAALRTARGAKHPYRGWQFPNSGQRVPAPQITMSTTPGRSWMTFTVRDAAS